MSIGNASGSKTFTPWRVAWSGDGTKHEGAVAAPKLGGAASLASPPLGCAGVDGMGRRWGRGRGGGCARGKRQKNVCVDQQQQQQDDKSELQRHFARRGSRG